MSTIAITITRINNLEAAAKLILEECHKTKKELLEGVYPPTARKGSEWTAEQRLRAKKDRMARMNKR